MKKLDPNSERVSSAGEFTSPQYPKLPYGLSDYKNI